MASLVSGASARRGGGRKEQDVDVTARIEQAAPVAPDRQQRDRRHSPLPAPGKNRERHPQAPFEDDIEKIGTASRHFEAVHARLVGELDPVVLDLQETLEDGQLLRARLPVQAVERDHLVGVSHDLAIFYRHVVTSFGFPAHQKTMADSTGASSPKQLAALQKGQLDKKGDPNHLPADLFDQLLSRCGRPPVARRSSTTRTAARARPHRYESPHGLPHIRASKNALSF